MNLNDVRVDLFDLNSPKKGQLARPFSNGVKVTHLKSGTIVCVSFYPTSQNKNLKLALKMLDVLPEENV